MAGKAKTTKKYFDDDFIESSERPRDTLKEVGKTAAKSVGNELAQETRALWEMMLGIGNFEVKGDMQPNEEVNLKALKKNEAAKVKEEEQKAQEKPKQESRIDAGWDYTGEIIHAEQRAATQQNRSTEHQVKEILFELKSLIKSSKVLETEFKEVAVMEMPANAGKYHVNFLEWMLVVIKQARQKVEDSNAWLSAMKGKGQKKDYWSMFKKSGTSFGLSGERVVATQTG